MLPHLLILAAGIILGFNFGIIIYALLLAARRHSRPSPPVPNVVGMYVHLMGIHNCTFPDAQRIAAALRLQ
jgi:xanthosine utilization system XapX-like protein